LQLAENHRQFVRRMFGVDQNPIEAGARDNFRGDVAAQTAPEAELGSTFGDGALESVGR